MSTTKYLTVTLVAVLQVLACYADELKVEVTSKPDTCDRLTKKYDQLKLHYTGTVNGKKFDSSYDRKEPAAFQIGVAQVIRGWDEGVLNMCVGEKRTLTVPPEMAYGDAGFGELIPPKSTLEFEIELVDIQDGQPPQNYFKLIDADADKTLTMEEVSDYVKKHLETTGAKDEDGNSHKKMVTEIFSHQDKNKDGVISHEEFWGPKDEL